MSVHDFHLYDSLINLLKKHTNIVNTHTHTHTLSVSLSHTHTLSLSLFHTHTLTHPLSFSLSLSLSHTHTHTPIAYIKLSWYKQGLQVSLGDIGYAIHTQEAFYGLWKQFHGLPERYLIKHKRVHSTEKYYPLRPEFVESTYYLYRATKSDHYLQMGEEIFNTLEEVLIVLLVVLLLFVSVIVIIVMIC